MGRKKRDTTLSAAGQRAEKVLTTLLDDMAKDAKLKADDRRYTLTDAMKIIDRVAKFEMIRARVKEDDEGSFFTKREPEPDDERADDETGNPDC